MNILHLTDLHYNSESYEKFSQHDMIRKLLDYLKSLRQEIDLVIFSGDLVFKGNSIDDFYKAKIEFLDKICETLNITSNEIILCAGNHDMDRTFRSESLEERFDTKIKNTDSLYNFFKNQNDYDFITSLNTTKNYNLFVKEFYTDKKSNKLSDLYSIHIRKIKGCEVGILSINSSWRSVDDSSNGKLLFPKHLLEEAFFQLKDINCKFLVMHHPIHWFKDFNQGELQNLIYKSCNIMLSGHIHESEISTHYKQNNGIFAHVSPASLTWDKDYVGFSVIEFDSQIDSNATVYKHHYSKEKDSFHFIDRIKISIPSGSEKIEQNRIREKINSKINVELLNAKDLLLTNNYDDENEEVFLDLFNNPKLKLKPKQELSEANNKEIDSFNFSNILINEKNYFIYGSDKTGKSSLLKYIQIYHLKNYIKNGNIPFYIDFKNENSKSIIDDIRKYFEINKATTIDLIQNHNFRLLIDNFDPKSSYINVINDFLTEYPNVNFIVTCDYLTSRLFDEYEIDDREYQKIYMHDISRNDVRTFIEKNDTIQSKKHDNIVEKILTFCKQLELPLSYWTVSLLLMVHKKSQIDLSKNIYNLLDLCVDEILQKKYNVLNNSKVSFSQLKGICAHLAKFLLVENNSNLYSKSYVDILNELDKYFETNNRIKAQPKEILEYLIKSGVLKIKENEMVTFRLNGIFEFFIAQSMSEDTKFRDEMLKDEVYLSFKNEFEIYSGIKNNDRDFLKTIFNKTESYFEMTNKRYREIGTIENILISKVSDKNDVNLAKIVKLLKPIEPVSNVEKDKLMEEYDKLSPLSSEVNLKKMFNISNLDSEVYERYIAILARVFKTMDGVNDADLLSKIIELLLETYINFGFFIHEEIELEISDSEIESQENVLEIISKFLPFITQVTMSENIGQHNIENLLISKIEELKINYKSNQYKLFILYFVLMDIDDENIYNYVDELIDLMEIGVLKYSTIFKLNYYFSFKGSNNNRMAHFLKEKIKYAQLKLDNKTDKDRLQQRLDSKF